MGGVLISDRVAAPFLDGRAIYLNGFTFGGHPVGAAVALAALDAIEPEGVLENVRANEPVACGGAERASATSRSSATSAALGHFWAIELVRDQETKETFDGPAAEWLLKDVLSEELWGRGLICRLDDRAEPIVQIAPPLVASAELIEEIAAILRCRADSGGRATGSVDGRSRPELAPSPR